MFVGIVSSDERRKVVFVVAVGSFGEEFLGGGHAVGVDFCQGGEGACSIAFSPVVVQCRNGLLGGMLGGGCQAEGHCARFEMLWGIPVDVISTIPLQPCARITVMKIIVCSQIPQHRRTLRPDVVAQK
jgi:hypothetical protein